MVTRLVTISCLQDRFHFSFFLYDRGGLRDLLAENVSLDKVREPNGELIRDEALCWNGKDLCRKSVLQSKGLVILLTVNLLQGELLGFSDEAENHEPGD